MARRFPWAKISVMTVMVLATSAIFACMPPHQTRYVFTVTETPVQAVDEGEGEAAPKSGSVVQLFNFYGGFIGSAVVVAHVDGRTYLATAEHVIKGGDGEDKAVRTMGGFFKVEAIHKTQDLAIVSAGQIIGTPFELGGRLDYGDPVTCLGYFEGRPTMTKGHIANPVEGWVDATHGYGMSGGAVTHEGKLVGVIESTFEPIDIGGMVDVHHVRTLMEEVGL